ncbi:MAG TPA: ubiquinone biosynthesis regulatory protein kinase UbiB [Aeromonadales bacterium]|nr:ubiquinone biosynthesis regulatory protein kinase UbiB [Aeromonadales bacterium]
MSGKRLLRVYRIQSVMLHYGLDEFLKGTRLHKFTRLLHLLQPFNTRRLKQAGRGERLRMAMQELGPVFIKFGQLLSTRKDMFPDDITEELAYLQDRVEPFAGTLAQSIIEQSLGAPIAELFAEFEVTPLASASIAQVHGATLNSGEDVVIKLLRPDVERCITRDLDLLEGLAQLIHNNYREARRMRLPEVVADYRKTIFDELDLRREAANAAQLKRNFEGSPDLFIPKVYWDFSRDNIMVMERIYGVPVSDIKALKTAGVNMQRLAAKGVEVFFTQVFRDNFFHADMHPGNIFVDTTNKANPRYIGIDCGIMGSLTTQDQRYLAENFVAFFNRDYHKVAQLHLDSGWVPEGTSVAEFEAAIRTVCEPIFGRPLHEISFGQFLIQLFQVARRFDMEVQPQLVLLEKTLLYVEGLGRQLYPQLDLWQTAKPYLENWLKERMGIKQLIHEVKNQLPYWREKLPEMPQILYESLNVLPHLPQQLDAITQALDEQSRLAKVKMRFVLITSMAASSTLTAAILSVIASGDLAIISAIVATGLWAGAYFYAK